MTDETVVRRKVRKVPPEVGVQSTLPGDETPEQSTQEPTTGMRTGEFRRTLAMTKVTPLTPTLVQYVGSTIPKGMWQLVPISGGSLGALWTAWRAEFGAGDPERFLKTVLSELGLMMDGAVKAVSTLTLE